jgi:hypothetical protein
MSEASRDKRSEMARKFEQLAGDAVAPLRSYSDAGVKLTPAIVLEVQARVQKILEQVHYGFHPILWMRKAYELPR